MLDITLSLEANKKPRRFLTRPDSWARADILEGRVPDGLGEKTITILVCTREGNTARARATSIGNLDLEA